MKIKICGIRTENDLVTALRAGADAVGFITEVPVNTPRNITLETAARLISKVPVFVTSVLVIMPDNAKAAIDMIHTARPTAVQIHSHTELSELITIRGSGVKLIKTLLVSESSDRASLIKQIGELEGIVDAVLLDTAVSGKSGGTGVTHNWELSSEIVSRSPIPVILAGGLNPGKVYEAVRTVSPYAADTASGVETDGKKDEIKVAAFISNARKNGI